MTQAKKRAYLLNQQLQKDDVRAAAEEDPENRQCRLRVHDSALISILLTFNDDDLGPIEAI